ncbi:MAG: hypothetical protein KGL39_28405 [Patescibacteria group bacterium]|nr:hypothetical protein [Patescibacteria group bacterium]
MKKLFLALAVAAAAAIGSGVALAQNAVNAPPQNFFTNAPAQVQPFINTLANWATSYNTNNTWQNGLRLDTGVATTTGQQIADQIQLIDDFGNFEIGISGKFTGVGSAFNSAEAIFGYGLLNKYDLKIFAQVGLGYDFNTVDSKGKKNGALLIDPGIEAVKKITANTYAVAGYFMPVETVGKFNTIGTLYIGAGFTF